MAPETSSSVRRACNAILVAVFALAIVAPIVDQLVRDSDMRNAKREYRTPAPRPKLPKKLAQWSTFPSRFDDYYLDHFGLRDYLLRWHNVAKFKGLRTAPTSKIVLGRDGWIFPTAAGMALEDHRGALPLSDAALEAWRGFLERRRDYLAQRGIQYVFVIAPQKTRICADRLPARYDPIGPARADQLIEHMARTSDFRVVDLREVVMAEERKDAPDDYAFFPFGTHWTDRGAHAGYVKIVSELGRALPGIAPLPDDAFEVKRMDFRGDTWAGRLYMEDLLKQANPEWLVREPHAKSESDPRNDVSYHSEREPASLPRAFVYHDSFVLPLRPWLAEHFSQLDCTWTQELDFAQIEAAKPDVVLEIYSEFTLLQLTPHSTRAEDAGDRERRFERSANVLWRFDPERFPEGLEVDGKGSMRLEDGVLVQQRASPTDLLLLPELEYPPGANVLVKLDLEASRESAVELFYCTRLFRSIDRNRKVSSRVNAGRDVVVFEVPAADLWGRLGFWVAAKPDTLRIHALEIRASVPGP